MQRLSKFRFQLNERTLNAASAADQDVIGAGNPRFGEHQPCELTKSPFHPIADDRIADLLGNGEAEAKRGIAVVARTDEQHEPSHRRASAAVRGQEIRAAADRPDVA